LTVLIKTAQGKSEAVNLAQHSWEAAPLEGDDTKVKMVLDNGKAFIIKLHKYNVLMEQLAKLDNFLVLD